MVKYDKIPGTDLIKAYSDKGMRIHGGMPEGDYAEAIDPVAAGRKYIETDIPINPPETTEEATVEDYQAALRNMGVQV